VRITQPCRPPVWLVFVAGLSWRVLQLSPPSVDRAKSTGSDPAVPRKPTLQTYALPKCGLDSALSAQTCSLSLKSAEFCRVTITGSNQASLSPAIAPAMSSVREIAIAPAPGKPCWLGKLVAMFV
jgi:hypothetical protein